MYLAPATHVGNWNEFSTPLRQPHPAPQVLCTWGTNWQIKHSSWLLHFGSRSLPTCLGKQQRWSKIRNMKLKNLSWRPWNCKGSFVKAAHFWMRTTSTSGCHWGWKICTENQMFSCLICQQKIKAYSEANIVKQKEESVRQNTEGMWSGVLVKFSVSLAVAEAWT